MFFRPCSPCSLLCPLGLFSYSISRFANFATSFRFPDFSKKTVRRASSPSPSMSRITPGPRVGWRTRLPHLIARRGALGAGAGAAGRDGTAGRPWLGGGAAGMARGGGGDDGIDGDGAAAGRPLPPAKKE